jgi:hypothetical protein
MSNTFNSSANQTINIIQSGKVTISRVAGDSQETSTLNITAQGEFYATVFVSVNGGGIYRIPYWTIATATSFLQGTYEYYIYNKQLVMVVNAFSATQIALAESVVFYYTIFEIKLSDS